MRKLFLFVMAAMWAASMWAVLVRPGLYRMEKQPDGTEVKVFIHGDEWFNYETDSLDNVFERDTKGHLKRDARGFLINTHKKMTDEYAQQQWQTARRKMQEQNGPRKAVGTPREIPRVLVILVEFPDTTFHKGNRTKKDWDDFFNKEGYNYNGAIGSVRDYFIAQSGGKYKPQFDVVGPVTALNKWKNYDTQGLVTPVKSLTHDVCGLVDEEVDFTKYDADNDGKIDLVVLIYAGYNYCDKGIGIWPHHSYASGEFDGKQLSEYCCTSELTETSKRANIGILCHEFSHALGMPDYYVGCGNGNKDLVPMNWSLMSSGDNLQSPPNYSIFDKYYMGWDAPKGVLKIGESVTLKPSEGYVVTRDGKMPKYYETDTVYYLENRQQTGMDKYAPGHGLLIWRVIYDQLEWGSNNVNFVENVVRLMVVPSQGTFNFWHIKAGEEEYQTFPGPAKTTSQLLFGYHLRNIKEDSEGNITFTATTPCSLSARQKDPFITQTAGKVVDIQGLFSASPNVLFQHKIDLKFEVSGDDDTSFELQYAPHIYKSESNPTFTGIQSFSATKKQMQKGFVWQTEDKIEKKKYVEL